jgi:acetolactate synthase-1/2/3 large subunit
VKHHQLPLKMVILNNQCHGMVRQFQQSYFDERYQSTCWGYSAPDFVTLARAYGIDAMKVSEASQVPEALETMWRDPAVPFLLEVAIETSVNVYPKIAFGHPFTDMEPFVKPVPMDG